MCTNEKLTGFGQGALCTNDNEKPHRIWTGGAAPSSNPVSFSFVHISKALIHTVQNAYFSQKCCTYWEPDTPGSQSHPHSALCLSNRTIQLVSMSVGPRLIVALS